MTFENNEESCNRSPVVFLFAPPCTCSTWQQNNIRCAFARKRAILRVAAHLCIGPRILSRETKREARIWKSAVVSTAFFSQATFRTKCLGIALMAFRSSFESRTRNAPSRSHVHLNYNPRVRRVRNNRRHFIATVRVIQCTADCVPQG